MLKNDPEYFKCLFTEEEIEMISCMINKDINKRITIDDLLEKYFKEMEDWTYSKTEGIKKDQNKIETNFEDDFINKLWNEFTEFEEYEDIEIDYQIKEYKKKLENVCDEDIKLRLNERLNLVKKQLMHKFSHKEFEYTRGPMIIDDVV